MVRGFMAGGTMGRGAGGAGGTTRRGAGTSGRTIRAGPGGGTIGAGTTERLAGGAGTAGTFVTAGGATGRGGACLRLASLLGAGEGLPTAGAGVTVAGAGAGAVCPATQAPSNSVMPSAAAAYAGGKIFIVRSSGGRPAGFSRAVPRTVPAARGFNGAPTLGFRLPAAGLRSGTGRGGRR